MWCPPAPDARGFTLLECEVALFVFALVLLGMFRLASDHEQLLATLDERGAEPVTLWVRPAEDPLARALGAPAQLLEREPRGATAPLADPELEVLDVGRDLLARRSWAVVRRPEPGRGRGDDEDTDDDDARDDDPGRGRDDDDHPGRGGGR